MGPKPRLTPNLFHHFTFETNSTSRHIPDARCGQKCPFKISIPCTVRYIPYSRRWQSISFVCGMILSVYHDIFPCTMIYTALMKEDQSPLYPSHLSNVRACPYCMCRICSHGFPVNYGHLLSCLCLYIDHINQNLVKTNSEPIISLILYGVFFPFCLRVLMIQNS